ncbi:MAG: acetate--CoA ligase family protein [Alphaproteobacteria bacterium]
MPRDEAATAVAPEADAKAAPGAEARLAIVPARKEFADVLLRPASVAIVGAGNESGDARGRPLHLLRQYDFRGNVYPVNASRRFVQGTHAWPALSALPGPVDVALILVEGDAAIDAVEACGRARIPLAVVNDALAGDDDVRRARRERLLDAARRHGLRVLGPGSAGLAMPASDLALTTDPAFAVRRPRAGRLMALAAGGSAMGTLFSSAAARDLGFAGLVSLGEELDLSLGEIGEIAAADPDIDGFLLFLGGLKRTATLARFAAAAHAANKPIVAYKLRRTAAFPAVPQAKDAAADAFLAANGIARVDRFETLLEIAPLLQRRRPARGRTAAIVAVDASAGAMLADRLGAEDVALDGLDDLARERLAQAGIALPAGPVAELPPAPKPDAMRAVLDEALDAPNNDAVLAVLGADAALDADGATSPLIAAAQRADKPLAALMMAEAPKALRLLSEAGIAVFRSPETAADGARAFLHWSPPVAAAPLADEEALPVAARALHAGQAMQIFRMIGITIPTMFWLKRDTEPPRSMPFPPPYVVKVLSPHIRHPADVGGIALGLETVSALRHAIETVTVNAAAADPDAFLDGVAIQRLERGLAEVAIRFERDPAAGPIVTLAMGEGMEELYDDRAVRPAPIDRAAAYAMIDEVRGLVRLRGYRNRAAGDLEALAQALVAMSSFALITAPRVLAAAVDPLLVRGEGQGIVALDGWMRTE